ncbi:MAG: MFS transporter [Theionarchaea archaeon]|nr:MFS transporter [Theionarchaea archaeon]MBU7001488.1 MFS transporter [Theionarchaea archaeon]MBU7021534.1 MFS transporter [Theionarchaea archaeon]MBU7034065.1 MFS transporter [Theionarchaea archaeon]MBU7041437.1 MFS transporter [Theionarchaea archaeon]
MRSSRYRFLALVTVGGLISYVAKMLIPPLIPTLQEEFVITNFQAGLLMTGYMGAYAVAQIPSGLLGEKCGRRRVMVAGMAGSAVTSLLVAFSHSYLQVLLLRVLFGGFSGNYYTPATSVLAQRFNEKERGVAQGILMMGVPAGTALAPLLALPISERWGWRMSFLLISLAGMAISILFYVLTEEKKEPTHMRDQMVWSSHIFVLGICSLFTGAAVFGLLTFFPKFLLSKGLEPDTAAFLFSVLAVSGLVSVPACGKLSDHLGRFKVLTALFTMLALSLMGFLLVPSRFFFCLVIPTGAALYGYVPPLMAFVADMSPPKARGFWVGYTNTMVFVGAAFGSAVAGLILDHYTYSELLQFFIVLVLIALVIYIAKVRTVPQTTTPSD